MAKTLIIKQADFSANALDHVSFDEVPCTAITLDEESISFSGIGQTEELVYTLTPSNTTDTPVVTTSDPLIVSVNGNVLTAVGMGTATITVTCGEITATCSVTVSVEWVWGKGSYPNLNISSGNLRDYVKNESGANMIWGGASSGKYYAIGQMIGNDGDNIYPYPIPAGSTHISFSGTNLGPIFQFFLKDQESEDLPSPSSTYRDTCAKLITGETPNGGTQWSISEWTYGSRTVEIPEGVDSFVIGIEAKTTTTYNNFDPEDPGITITFS